MKRKIYLLGLLLSCCTLANSMSGNGTKQDPYQLNTSDDLYEFASIVNKGDSTACAILMNDIVLNENLLDENGNLTEGDHKQWESIGSDSIRFQGIFDGNAKRIEGFYMDMYTLKIAGKGFFGTIGNNGKVKSLQISNSFYSDYSSALLCGNINYGQILDCSVIDHSDATYAICLQNKGGVINCYANRQISRNSKQDNFINCHNTSSKSKDLENGVLAYALSENATNEYPSKWGQELGTDPYPILNGPKVYKTAPCPDYTNSDNTMKEHDCGDDYICACGYCGFLPNENDIYEIRDSAQLFAFFYLIMNDSNSIHGILKENIVMNKNIEGFATLGTINKYDFGGTLDGDDHFISGFECTNYGLFYKLQEGGVVKNLTIKDAKYSSTKSSLGSICALNYGTIENCTNEAEISGYSEVGGMTGSNYGTIIHCINNGVITAKSDKAGGIAGANRSLIKNSYNTASIIANSTAGGIFGYGYSSSTVENCFNSSSVKSGSSYGIGCSYDGTFLNSYANLDSCESIHKGGIKLTTIDFESGRVAYLLPDNIFGQEIRVEKHPVFNGKKVYQGYGECKGFFSNDATDLNHGHNYVDDICTLCDHCSCQNESGEYEISTLSHLKSFVKMVNYYENYEVNAKLMNELVLNEFDCNDPESIGDDVEIWTPIAQSNKYKGTFDGQNHTITGLYYKGSKFGAGLFANSEGVIKNLKLKNTLIISSNSAVGAFVGQNYGKVSNCSNSGNITSTRDDVGGICGWSGDGTLIEDCINEGSVKGGRNYTGGICGSNYHAQIIRCGNHADVYGGEEAGGICNISIDNGNTIPTVDNCYNLGSVEAIENTERTGGIVGRVYGYCTISNSYNAGKIKGNAVVGYIDNFKPYNNTNAHPTIIENLYYLNECMTDSVYSSKNVVENADIKERNDEQFANGEVCYALNKGVTDGTQPFYQNIAERKLRSLTIDQDAPSDKYPTLDTIHGTVFNEGDIYFNYSHIVTDVENELADNNTNVYTLGNTICVEGSFNQTMIIDPFGHIVAISNEHPANDKTTFNIEKKGVYVVIVDGISRKIVVK